MGGKGGGVKEVNGGKKMVWEGGKGMVDMGYPLNGIIHPP